MLPLARFVLEGCCSIHLSYGRGLYANNLTRSGWRPVKHPRRPDSENVVPPAAPNAVQDPSWCGLRALVHLRGPLDAVVVENCALPDGKDVGWPAAPDAVEVGRGPRGLGTPVRPIVVEDRAYGAHHEDVRRPAAPHRVAGHRCTRLQAPTRPIVVQDPLPADRENVRRPGSPDAEEILRGQGRRLRAPLRAIVVDYRRTVAHRVDVRRSAAPHAL